ncbi:arginine--tRNA ligase [Candidatus Micrarchaeota archaeon CG10_big_fil_rev_8_21_14_0_10_54_18]|nr:MAG: arginine--tRNA ligase [Candidatus Micrarchaeota archaeon CG10_big_fil_rev_8_21_14_0_10_54_18]
MTAFGNALEEATAFFESKGLRGVIIPRERSHGDVACPAFAPAKEKGLDPRSLAEDIASEFKATQNFSRAVAENGYVNLFFSDAFLAKAIRECVEAGAQYGSSGAGNGKTIVIDYSSPNVGKPLHIGHIRSTILGDSIKRLKAFTGWNAIGSNYLCEAGKQVASLMYGLKHYGVTPKSEADLLNVYVRISKEMDEDESTAEEVRAVLEKMESGEIVLRDELAVVRDVSVKGFNQNYGLLGVSFEEELFDSDLIPAAKKCVEEALRKNVAFTDEGGEVVVALEKHGLPNLVLLRSNGTTLYSTRDLALADRRFKEHEFDEALYVTASEQNNHFRQVFKILELMGRPYADELKHLGFGLIFLPEGKLSTREGRVLGLKETLDAAIASAGERVKDNERLNQDQKKEVAKIVGVGATKFAVLRVSPEKNITFNPEEATRFEGYTGAFLQYAAVRCSSILEKGGSFGTVQGEFNEEECALAAKIALFSRTVQHASDSMRPHELCDYLLDLANAFTSFYSKHSVLNDEPHKQKRLTLVKATRTVLENGLNLLGIECPEKM